MKKLLIIDDKYEVNSNTGNVIFVADKWRKEKVSAFASLVEVTKSPEEYFKWDAAGNDCQPIFDTDAYEYVFIHHSQKGDSVFPSNIIDLIKLTLGSKLILFSGSIKESLLNTERPDFVYRSISRPKLWERMREFIQKSVLLNEWVIEILFYDYEKRLIGQIMQMQDEELSLEEIIGSTAMDHILRLKGVGADSPVFNKIIKCDGFDLINELRKL